MFSALLPCSSMWVDDVGKLRSCWRRRGDDGYHRCGRCVESLLQVHSVEPSAFALQLLADPSLPLDVQLRALNGTKWGPSLVVRGLRNSGSPLHRDVVKAVLSPDHSPSLMSLLENVGLMWRVLPDDDSVYRAVSRLLNKALASSDRQVVNMAEAYVADIRSDSPDLAERLGV